MKINEKINNKNIDYYLNYTDENEIIKVQKVNNIIFSGYFLHLMMDLVMI